MVDFHSFHSLCGSRPTHLIGADETKAGRKRRDEANGQWMGERKGAKQGHQKDQVFSLPNTISLFGFDPFL